MKKITFAFIFILTHILFIFAQINKYNRQIRLSYEKQKYENELKELLQRKQSLTQNLCNLQKNSTTKKYALERLCMTRVGIKQIRTIDSLNKTKNDITE